MYDVICLGSATIDIFLTIHQRLKSVSYGSKVLVKDLEIFTGGGGTNAAVALSRLGLKVGFLGKVGDDHNGEMILKELEKEKVRVLKTKLSKEHMTSLSMILKSELEQDRVIYTYKGASDDLGWNDVGKLETKWIYLGTLLGKSFRTAERLVGFCKKNKIKVMFNPSTYLAAKGTDYLKRILSGTNIIVLNKSEAKLLLKTKKNNIKFLLKKLKEKIKDVVVITEGAKGVHVYDGKFMYSMGSHKIKVMHTAGAGDAFNSGFLAGIAKGLGVEKALELGMAESASVIQKYGTKNGLVNYNQALKFIKSHKKNILKVLRNQKISGTSKN